MKKLFLLISLLSLFAFNAFASGCMPSDVQLGEETVLATLPDNFAGTMNCYENGECWLYANSDKPGYWREFYYLSMAGNAPLVPVQTFKNLELKVYKQFFVSSCTELYRVVIGTDVDGKRFRSEKDLDSL